MLALSQFFADLDLPSRKPCKPWRTERIFATSRRRSGSASEARVTPDRELTGDPNPTHRLAANLTNWIETVMTHPSTVRRPSLAAGCLEAFASHAPRPQPRPCRDPSPENRV